MLLTLIAPTHGSIELFGLNLAHNRNEILKQVGAVIEKTRPVQISPAYENLKLFAQIKRHKSERQIADEPARKWWVFLQERTTK